MKKATQRGFTLIEILLVVLIILILAVVVLVALKPANRLAATRNARRGQDIGQILTGIHQCVIDSGTSTLSTCIGSHTTGDTYEIVTSGTTTGCDDVCTGVTSDTHCLALNSTLSDYFVSLPTDPGGVATGHTEYSLKVYSNGTVQVSACSAEDGEAISVSR